MNERSSSRTRVRSHPRIYHAYSNLGLRPAADKAWASTLHGEYANDTVGRYASKVIRTARERFARSDLTKRKPPFGGFRLQLAEASALASQLEQRRRHPTFIAEFVRHLPEDARL